MLGDVAGADLVNSHVNNIPDIVTHPIDVVDVAPGKYGGENEN